MDALARTEGAIRSCFIFLFIFEMKRLSGWCCRFCTTGFNSPKSPTQPFVALVELLAGGIAVEARQHRPTMSYLASLASKEGGRDLLITLSKREADFVAADWWDKW